MVLIGTGWAWVVYQERNGEHFSNPIHFWVAVVEVFAFYAVAIYAFKNWLIDIFEGLIVLIGCLILMVVMATIMIVGSAWDRVIGIKS